MKLTFTTFANLVDGVSIADPLGCSCRKSAPLRVLVVDIAGFQNDLAEFAKDLDLAGWLKLDMVEVIFIQTVAKLVGYLTLVELGEIDIKAKACSSVKKSEQIRRNEEKLEFLSLESDSCLQDDYLSVSSAVSDSPNNGFTEESTRVVIWGLFNSIVCAGHQLYKADVLNSDDTVSIVEPNQFNLGTLSQLMVKLQQVERCLAGNIQLCENPNIVENWTLLPVPVYSIRIAQENMSVEEEPDSENELEIGYNSAELVGKGYESLVELYEHLYQKQGFHSSQATTEEDNATNTRTLADSWFHQKNIDIGKKVPYVYFDEFVKLYFDLS